MWENNWLFILNVRKCSSYLTILTLLISRLFGKIRDICNHPLPLINRQTSVLLWAPKTKCADFPFQFPLFLSITSPLQWAPRSSPKNRSQEGEKQKEEEAEVEKECGLAAPASNLCDTSQPPAFLLLHTQTHTHSIPRLSTLSNQPTRRSLPSTPDSDSSMCQPAVFLSVHSSNTWSRLPSKHEEQGVRVHNTDCASRQQMCWIKTSLTRWAVTTLSHPI